MPKVSKYLMIIIILILSAIIAVLFSKIVPYNADEFTTYQVIYCNYYEHNSLNKFPPIGCGSIDLNFLNTSLMLFMHSGTEYTGSFASFYYYPLFLVWRSPLSARFLGMIFILISAVLLGRIFKIGYEKIFVGLVLFFPFFFVHLVDTGPVKFQVMSIFLLYYLLIKWCERFKIIYPILISIVIFIGIWDKLTYLMLIPGILIILLIFLFENTKRALGKNNLKKLLIQGVVSALILLFLMSMLFLSVSEGDGRPHFTYVLDWQLVGEEHVPDSIKDHGVFRTLINPFEAVKKIYHVKEPNVLVYIYILFIYLSPLFLIGLTIVKSKKKKKDIKKILKPLIMYLAFIVTILIMFRIRGTDCMHHTILAYPFLILSFFTALQGVRKVLKPVNYKKLILIWCVVFVILNAYFFIVFPSQSIIPPDHPSKIEVNRILNDEYLAKNYFYVVVDWGMYSYQSLYGNKHQSVLYIDPLLEQEEIDRLKEMSKEHQRKLLFIYLPYRDPPCDVCEVSDMDLIKANFELEECIIHKDGWNIMYEMGDRDICEN